jgi:N-acyl-D-amino-acid deacylase
VYDLLIRNATVYDGLGHPPWAADVAIAGDRIAHVGQLAGAQARRVVDAQGQWLCPGFIDVHSHSDVYLLIEPSAPSKVRQGVTTEIVGNCGASAAPRFGSRRLPADWEAVWPEVSWCSLGEYRTLLESRRPAINVALLVGHNALRGCVIGYEARATRPDEMRAMKYWLERSLEEGAIGLSTGLAYAPGRFAPAEEIVQLAAVAAARGALYTTHMRSEGDRLVESVCETLAVTRAIGVRTQISHLKTSGERNWGKLDRVLELVEEARAEGLPVAADRYPYIASSTDLDVVLPDWASAGTREEIIMRLRDPTSRSRLRHELCERYPRIEDWQRICVGSVGRCSLRRYTGRSLADIATEQGAEPVDVLLDLLTQDALATQAFFFGMSEDNLWRILGREWVMLGSDASVRHVRGPLSRDYPHPRAFGTFPRFLRASIEGRTVPVPEAIRKMTSLPARQFGLRDRGELRPGAYADLVLISPDRVRDRATFANPRQFADGIASVIVNGVIAWDGQRQGTRRAGRVLTHE